MSLVHISFYMNKILLYIVKSSQNKSEEWFARDPLAKLRASMFVPNVRVCDPCSKNFVFTLDKPELYRLQKPFPIQNTPLDMATELYPDLHIDCSAFLLLQHFTR